MIKSEKGHVIMLAPTDDMGTNEAIIFADVSLVLDKVDEVFGKGTALKYIDNYLRLYKGEQ